MRSSVTSKLVLAIVICGLALTGCAKGSKLVQPAAVTAANHKPALKVPASFADDTAKRDFAVKAVDDGYYKEAQPLLEQVVAAKPDAIAYSRLGTVKYQASDYPGAIDAWTNAAELDHKMAGEMKNNIGNALRDNRNTDEAMAAYKEALQIDPTYWLAAVNWSTLLKAQNKLPEAIKVLEATVSANPNVQQLTTLLESFKSQLKK